MIYEPKTMIGRAALKVWNLIGKCQTPLRDAEDIVRSIRFPDTELVRRVAEEIGVPPSTVDMCWCRMIDAILTEVPKEQNALDQFGESTQ